MHSPLVEQNYSKNFPFLLMSESPCLLITLFHVLSSVPTCALKSPGRTINSADVAFCKATPSSSKKGLNCPLAFDPYTCKIHRDLSCRLNLKRQTLPLSEMKSVTQWAKRGIIKMPTPA